MEENYEFLQTMENISRLSFEIQVIYSKLTLLEVSKDITEDYDKQKKDLLDQLAILIDEETEYYAFFKEDFYLTEEALEFLRKGFKENVPEKYRLVQNRIIKKLESILLKGAIENEDEEYLEMFLEEEFFATLFLDKGYDMDTLIPLIDKLHLPIKESLNRHFVSTLNEDIKNPSNFDIRRILINTKLDFIYEESSQIEQECLSQGFDSLKINLSSETNLPDVDPKLKKDFFNKHLKDKLLDMLIVAGSCTEFEIALPEIIWFKTYLLYLDDTEIKDIEERLTDYTFQDQDIKEFLLKAIKDINLSKTVHNNSSKKTLN